MAATGSGAATPCAVPAGQAIAYIGLGANLGDSAQTLRQALRELAAIPGIQDCVASPFYRTAPVDASGPDFVNAVARVATTLAPLALLDALQALELRHGRQRPYRNAPRTLDLDLLLYGDVRMDTPRLTLPHPRMRERAFVLAPLRDLAPGMTLDGAALDTLLARCGGQDIGILPGGDAPAPHR
ncbi:2-amino-4-hydroxy-6-hydroxymethyldihydropteridine diphosphokinase [Bordetella bronchialis]|uniref:2-amino-4-hydroxy-6-hydroxymethyldihydropteridine pyrophosphokinase n=1 Tax=Bordetella bronchialis TaxID=463025 RepID=A0ABM6CPP2_9BORD|nr:2-amino-4-hydroxy-6-hydroxymethyldihydropteridine diphosphokinase [Bordetella bronchialis]ANN65911.1 2-amino-4-hydroxy-6-hydroxymethyldihydropteridine diphosphokinase [Bordetella bronchialis]